MYKNDSVNLNTYSSRPASCC